LYVNNVAFSAIWLIVTVDRVGGGAMLTLWIQFTLSSTGCLDLLLLVLCSMVAPWDVPEVSEVQVLHLVYTIRLGSVFAC
jgi:hypothetical protein